jgi:signal recognition particle subunit SRP54
MFDFLAKKFATIFENFSSEVVLNAQNTLHLIKEIESAMLEADIAYTVVKSFIVHLQGELEGKKVPKNIDSKDYVMRLVYEKILFFLGSVKGSSMQVHIPSIIMVMGLQGSGKTTTIAKLAHHFMGQRANNGKRINSILVSSIDFYRPAAINQLEILARQVKCSFYRAQSTDVVMAAQEIASCYRQGRYDLLLLDTAGRLHVDDVMMQELVAVEHKIRSSYKILVLDAMTGQESLRVAQSFNQAIGFDGAILTKMDSETRGGAAFAFRYAMQKPIIFLGYGEKITDLQKFHPDRVAQRMISMGDMETLLERIDQKVKIDEQKKASAGFESGNFTLNDFAMQLDVLAKVGSFASVAQYLPGMAGKISKEQLNQAEKNMKGVRALINSMTPKERNNHMLIDQSRRQRIAKGAGIDEKELIHLLQRFEEMRRSVTMYKKTGDFNNLLR